MPLLMKYPAPFLPVRHPTPEELDNCPVFDLRLTDQWAPELLDEMNTSVIEHHPCIDTTISCLFHLFLFIVF